MATLQKLIELARTFPSLARRTISTPDDLDTVARDPSNGSGVRHAARFLLYVWTAGGYTWDMAQSWGCWDQHHRTAWKGWAADPWFG